MLLSIEQQKLKYDFKYYVAKRLFIPYTDKEKYIITDLHLNCIKAVMDHSFTMIQAYRGFGKSELISYAFVLWRAEMWNESALILSANETLANMKLDLIRNAIETDNADLHYMYSGDMSNYSWNRGEIHLIDRKNPRMIEAIDPKTGYKTEEPAYNIKAKIFARSMFSTSRGLHVDNIIADDVVVEQNSESMELIVKTKRLFNESIIPIRKPKSRLVVVGTPQNEEDLLGSLKRNKLFKSIIIPALNDKGDSACPELHSNQFFSQQRTLLGERSFAQEYMLKPTVDTLSDFKYEVLNKARKFDQTFVQWHEVGQDEVVFIGTDFAVKHDKAMAEKGDTDYFSIAAISMNLETKKRKVLNLYRERGIKFSDQVSFAISWYYRYQAKGLCTEAHAFLDIFNQIINDVAKDIKIINTGTNSGKFDKVKGIPSMLWEWEKELWEVPCGDETSLLTCNQLFSELNLGERSKHDDLADAIFRAQRGFSSLESPDTISYTPFQKKVESHLLNLGRY